MFKHAQFESVKAWIGDPAQCALPLHVRIQRAVRQLILDGVLDVDKPLPASRALATSLGVSRDTIESAYGQLHAEGFIERRVGSGSFVSLNGHGVCRVAANLGARRQIARRRASASVVAPCFRAAVCAFLISRPFAPGVPETRSFPLAVWERLERQVLDAAADPSPGK